MNKKPVVLMILDGYDLNDNCNHNAICEGKTPTMDQPMNQCPFVRRNTSGMAVGLPDDRMGNSEVGHLDMGAGRIVCQEPTRITKSIQDRDFFQVPEFLEAVGNCKKRDSALHLFGLVSDGGVHSHNTRIYGLLELAKRHGLDKIYVHYFLNGRDTPPASGKDFVAQLEEKMVEIGVGEVTMMMGRCYAMDRDKNWDRVKFVYDAMTKGEDNTADSTAGAIQNSYGDGKNSGFMIPTVVVEDGKPVGTIKDHDSIIFYNFRLNHAKEITRAFCDGTFNGFGREKRLDVVYMCFTDHDETIGNKLVAFRKQSIASTFSKFLAAHDKVQARIVETEKYAHVTFFFDGGIEEPNGGENRVLVPSPKGVATYDLKPEISAPAVCGKLVEIIKSNKYDVAIINFANPGIVGHIGMEDAAIKAIETVDVCAEGAVDAIKEVDGVMFIYADHGNAEQLIDYQTGRPFTTHTTDPVPFIPVNADPSYKLREGGCLTDIALTLIELMELEQPGEITGTSLVMK